MSSPPLRPSGTLADRQFESYEYWAGNPDVEIAHGQIYATSGPEAQSVQPDFFLAAEDGAVSLDGVVNVHVPACSSSCVALASSVPCCMPVPEFIEWLGAFGDDTHRLFRHAKVLYGRSPEEYLVAIWLTSPEAAANLVQRFDGRPYNAIEPGVCRMHRVVGCVAIKDLTTGKPQERKRSSRGGGASSAGCHEGSPASSAAARKPSPSSSSAAPAQDVAPWQGTGSPQTQLRAPIPQSAAAAAAARSVVNFSPSRGPCRSPVTPPVSAPALDMGQLIAPEEELFHVPCGHPSRAGPKEGPFCSICREDIEECPANYQLTELGGAVPLTILCGHTFHARCLSHWCDSNCPLCRFQQHPNQTSSCDVCGQSEGIYICLVCSFIGCMDAEGQGHAQQHYRDTNHAYALEVSTQKVWDYAGKGYVHRLLFNHEDGKMVEHSGLPESPDGGASGGASLAFDWEGGWGVGNLRWADVSDFSCDDCHAPEDGGVLSGMRRRAKKQEWVVAEFNALLASQMTAQQQYFEERRREHEEAHATTLVDIRAELEAATAEAQAAQQRLDEALARNCSSAQVAEDAAAEEEVMRGQLKKLEELNKKISSEQAVFEKNVDNSREQELARKRTRNLEVEDLQQQIRDLELYVKMQKKLQGAAPGDIEGAAMVVTEAEPSGRGRGGRRGGRRR